LIWFVDKGFKIDMSHVKEIFIDATYGTAKLANHLYSMVGQELGYGIPLGFMIMEIHPKEDCRTNQHTGEALECNKHFYAAAKELGLEPRFVHTDKDFSEMTAVQVPITPLNGTLSASELWERGILVEAVLQ
jgi:hypothetical protein